MSSLFSLVHRLPPLTGGGFWVAFAQVALVYYGFAAAIHWVIPRFFEVESVQVGKRRPGQVKKEALLSIGAASLVQFFFFRFRVFFLSFFAVVDLGPSLLLLPFSPLLLSHSSCLAWKS